ncbi:MAG TPA: rhomboid family intramembrane serine protease [Candidatus Eisenbacteria bacterium]|uniref:Rhomboid family intramembrane serine protease n=1 Tax=Eiseniibacteriota bacterium TaxID=2212470 RepID=A0A7V2ATW5_UNCEI|nr:rhomboid family intramembrane serine protease [Candidatus Eisenbacteria bacterium]
MLFLPLKDLNPTRRTPVVTRTLIVMNILVFLYQLWQGHGGANLVASLGATPLEITRMTDLTGPVAGVMHVPGPDPIFLTLLSSMFLHGGFLHLAFNMLYLWIFGNNIEDVLGPLRFILFYLAAGLMAHAMHIASDPNSIIPTIGASGAISGVMGAYLVLFPQARIMTLAWIFIFIQFIYVPAFVIIIYWFVLQLISGMISLGGQLGGGVAWFAHIGGFLAGVFMILLMEGGRVYWLRRGGR